MPTPTAGMGEPAQGIRVLRNYQAQYPSLDLLNALFTLVLEQEGPEAAVTLIKDELARNPTLLGLDRLLEAQLLGRAGGAAARSRTGQGARRRSTSSGSACTNASTADSVRRQYYWRCPGCLKWETYSPRRTETPDGYA